MSDSGSEPGDYQRKKMPNSEKVCIKSSQSRKYHLISVSHVRPTIEHVPGAAIGKFDAEEKGLAAPIARVIRQTARIRHQRRE